MNRAELQAVIPHREDMLLLDEASVLPDGVAEGVYHVTGHEFFLRGHFPGNPVVPGVMLCEMMAQTCGILICKDAQTVTPYFAGIKNVAFKRPARPGDTVRFRCRVNRRVGSFYFVSGEGYVGDALCVRGEFSVAVLEKPAP